MANIPARQEGRPDGSHAATRARTVRIAIADDDPDSIELLRAALAGPAVHIEEATSGADLASLLAEHAPFDLIVTDVLMPWTEGLQVLSSARAAGWNTPVIVVTGLSGSAIQAKVDTLGKARLLRKPVAMAELRSAVADLMHGARTA